MAGCRRPRLGCLSRAPGPDSLMVRPSTRWHRAPALATTQADSPHERGTPGRQVTSSVAEMVAQNTEDISVMRMDSEFNLGFLWNRHAPHRCGLAAQRSQISWISTRRVFAPPPPGVVGGAR